jgi:hypothetical protein
MPCILFAEWLQPKDANITKEKHLMVIAARPIQALRRAATTEIRGGAHITDQTIKNYLSSVASAMHHAISGFQDCLAAMSSEPSTAPLVPFYLCDLGDMIMHRAAR